MYFYCHDFDMKVPQRQGEIKRLFCFLQAEQITHRICDFFLNAIRLSFSFEAILATSAAVARIFPGTALRRCVRSFCGSLPDFFD